MEYCPNCVEQLSKQSKKLGNLSSWLVCPKCGYRTRAKSFYMEEKEIQDFYKQKEAINSSNKFNEI